MTNTVFGEFNLEQVVAKHSFQIEYVRELATRIVLIWCIELELIGAANVK